MIAMLIARLAPGCVYAAWLGWREGNGARDVRLMLGMGGVLLVVGAAAAV